jgi:quercetin dioxygenase-like cupin family protein
MDFSSRSLLIGSIAAVFIAVAASADDAKEIRIPPSAVDFSKAEGAGAGTSGVTGIQTIVLKGDPTKPGLYTILLRVPAHTKIAAHHHPDDRVATVVSGTWYFGYGDKSNKASLRALPPGSFYTEPPNDNHFAETRDDDVLVQISGLGPTGTTYVDTANDPQH